LREDVSLEESQFGALKSLQVHRRERIKRPRRGEKTGLLDKKRAEGLNEYWDQSS